MAIRLKQYQVIDRVIATIGAPFNVVDIPATCFGDPVRAICPDTILINPTAQ